MAGIVCPRCEGENVKTYREVGNLRLQTPGRLQSPCGRVRTRTVCINGPGIGKPMERPSQIIGDELDRLRD